MYEGSWPCVSALQTFDICSSRCHPRNVPALQQECPLSIQFDVPMASSGENDQESGTDDVLRQKQGTR